MRRARRSGTAAVLITMLLELSASPNASVATNAMRPAAPSPAISGAPVALDAANVVEVEPAPIVEPPAGGGAGGAADPSIGVRLPVPPAAPVAARTELASARSEHSSTFAETDGTFTTELSPARLNFVDSKGEWQPIDLSLANEAEGAFTLRTSALDRTVRFNDDNADEALARVALGDRSVSLRTSGYPAVARRGAADNKLSFAGDDDKGAAYARPTETGFEFGV